jgi:hypothetical protein
MRLAALATAATMAASAGTLVTLNAFAAVGCRVGYAITNQWSGGFGATVTINNLGDALNGWDLRWSFTAGQTITQLWDGTVVQSGAQVTVTNASYNGSVPVGGTASFGFNGTWNGTNPVPSAFVLNGTTCTGSTPPTTTAPVTPTPPHDTR